MLVVVTAALAFAPSSMPAPRACVGVRRSVSVPLMVADDAAVTAAATKLRRAAAAFGAVQRDAADAWLEKTLAGGAFSSAALLQQNSMLFAECTIDDNGNSNCQALDEALVDLQGAMASAGAPTTSTGKRLAQSKINKAALAVRAAATKFGPAQKRLANEWLERALAGESGSSLLDESLALFGECELSEEGSKAPNKCAALSKAIEGLRVALDVDDMPGMVGKVVPTGKSPMGKAVPTKTQKQLYGMTDMEYRKMMAGERR